MYGVTAFYKKNLDLRGSLERGGNARRGCPRCRSERSTLLRVSPNAVAASHIIDIWPRHAITLVLNARVQRRRVPLRVVVGAVHGRCGLENYVVMLKINVMHRRMLTAGTQCGGGGRLARSSSGEYDCGVLVASDGGSGFPPVNAPSVSRRV
jgi:hypothetical protein